jgi:hypothetical protein
MSAAPPGPVTIARGGERPPETDFAALKADGIGFLQNYSGDIWTDFNEHDPGVTILEQLCYALTELGYRTGFPVEDLLAAASADEGDDILLRPSRLLATPPITPNDYRRLLIDRVPGLSDAWLEPASAGLYHLRLYRAPKLPALPDPHRPDDRLVRRARRVFVRHRALCEDLASATLLRPIPVGVEGRVAIDRGVNPEQVLAEILYRLGAYVAPEPRRRSLADLPGASQAAAMEGPALANGLIPDSELKPRRRLLDAAQAERRVAAAAGVLAVHELRFLHSATPLGEGQCFALDAGFDRRESPIALTAHGHRIEVDGAEVGLRLARLWAEHRRTYRTAAELARAFPPPEGRPRDTASYVPVSAHFPSVYGVGPAGLGPDSSPLRKAQAKQLLGYLALFDRTMVDYLDRLSNLRSILSPSGADPSKLARPLDAIIPSLAEIIIAGGPDADSLYGRDPISPAQQGRLADFLLALYGEDPGAIIPRRRGPSGDRHERRVKLALLEELAALGQRRGRGLDYLGKRSRRNAPGLERRARLLLGAPLERDKRRRPRLAVLENLLLLRPGEDPHRTGDEWHPMAVTVLVHGGDGFHGDCAWRGEAAQMIRAETPAHIAVEILFVDRPAWVRFKPLHRLWRAALRGGYDDAADLLSRDIRLFVEQRRERERDG